MLKIITSKEELFKMPESSYMDESQLDFFNKLINDNLNNCFEMVGRLTAELRDLKDNGTTEIIDQANTVNELSVNSRSLNDYRDRIKKLESALKRIKDGSFGFCELSGEEIGLKRLCFDPSITTTIEEQERKEKKAKHYN